jgi:hypothetical protein
MKYWPPIAQIAFKGINKIDPFFYWKGVLQMASSQAILNDVDLRYRNTFTQPQKLVWMNEEVNELYEILEIDSAPVNFPLQTDVKFYPIPDGVDIDRIKTISIQVNDHVTDPEFRQLPFRMNDDNSYTYVADLYYSIVGDSFFIPNGTVDDRQIYIYMDTPPDEVNTSNIANESPVPVRYQEILKLGVLKRIAMARNDITRQNNFDASYQEKISDLSWKMRMQEPEFRAPVDMMPRANRFRTGRYDYQYFSS